MLKLSNVIKNKAGGGFSPFNPADFSPEILLEASAGVKAVGGGAAGYLDPVAEWQSSGAGGHASQATGSLQPIYIAHTGTNFLHLPGNAGNSATVPSESAFNGLGDFSIQLDGLELSSWRRSQDLMAKWTPAGNKRCWGVVLNSSGTLSLYFSGNGSSIVSATSSVAVDSGGAQSIRVLRDGGNAKFYVDYGAGLVLLGTAQSISSSSTATNDAEVYLGNSNILAARMIGKLTRVRLWNTSTPDTSDAILDINFTSQSHNASSFSCTTGQTVTINTSGDDPATVVGRPFIRFDGVDDYLEGIMSGPQLTIIVARILGGETGGRVLAFSTAELASNDTGMIVLYNLSGSCASYINGDTGLFGDLFSDRLLYALYAVDGKQWVKDDGAETDSASSVMTNYAAYSYFIGSDYGGILNAAFDIEFIVSYPNSMSEADFNRAITYYNTQYSVY